MIPGGLSRREPGHPWLGLGKTMSNRHGQRPSNFHPQYRSFSTDPTADNQSKLLNFTYFPPPKTYHGTPTHTLGGYLSRSDPP